MNKRVILLLLYKLFLSSPQLSAQVRLPALVKDSMILQRDHAVNIWGWASPKERITIQFQQKKYRTTTGADGRWWVKFPPMKAGGPYTMDITGKNKIVLKEILIGDVWFCSGQSNMVHQLNIHDVTYAQDIATANYPQIRQFWVPTVTSLDEPQADFPSGNWKAAVGQDVRPFSAVAYFFAKDLFERYHVPVGIINASAGGTPI
ncbi:MAG: sialate O-acetylesterase, partial [Chitinophagaceae bacterium]